MAENSSIPRTELLDALERALRQASAQSVIFSHVVAEQAGMNSTDMECLDLLRLGGPMAAGQLAGLTGLTTGAITGVIDRLQEAGYVERHNDPKDRRRVIVQPVLDNLHADFGPFFSSLARAMEQLYSRYSDEELSLLLDFVVQANRVVQEVTARVRERPAAARKAKRSRAGVAPSRSQTRAPR